MAQTPRQVPPVGIIDDDADIRSVLHMLLEDEGYRVSEAADGRAGYALVRDAPEPMIFLVDHHMPAMDGCDLLELIATDMQLRARHCFIFSTGSPPHVVKQDCGDTLDDLDAGVVAKPFNVDDILDALTAAATRLTGA